MDLDELDKTPDAWRAWWLENVGPEEKLAATYIVGFILRDMDRLVAQIAALEEAHNRSTSDATHSPRTVP